MMALCGGVFGQTLGFQERDHEPSPLSLSPPPPERPGILLNFLTGKLKHLYIKIRPATLNLSQCFGSLDFKKGAHRQIRAQSFWVTVAYIYFR